MRTQSRRLGLIGTILAATVAVVTPVAATDDPPDFAQGAESVPHGAESDAVQQLAGVGAPSFNESESCGAPGTSNPLVTHQGWLTPSQPVRGYKGSFFGRTIGDIDSRLVSWVVPMSGGFTIRVHPRALPAFQRVTANLNAEAAKGRHYQVRANQTWGWAPRTVGGSYSLSHHALGTTIDINAPSNPYRSDGVLVTNMPSWFVDAWRNAGFCWGGDWGGVKDPMHFSWMGPNHTPNYGTLPAPYPPKTSATGFGNIAAAYDLPWGALTAGRPYLVADTSGNGLPDVAAVVDHPGGIALEFSRTNGDHLACATSAAAVPGIRLDGRTPLLGDRDGKGGNDLWLLDTSGDTLTIVVALRAEGYGSRRTIGTAIDNSANDVHLLGDYNRDGHVDLYVVRRGSTSTRVQVYSGADRFATRLADSSTPLGDTRQARFALGDRNVDGRPDLYVASGSNRIRILHHGFGTVDESLTVELGTLATFGVGDFDGDGRDDLFLLRTNGRLVVQHGNTALAGHTLTSWFKAPNWTCPQRSGVFVDDDTSVHEADIEYIAEIGVTRGCNPPVNDRFCPRREVTRGEMAAFLVRALNLPPTSEDHFTDDDGSVFQQDINRLAAARITLGCNPPANTRFCPTASVTRGQMAAFLVRAFELRIGAGTNRFTDDDGSVFENDIDRLAASRITLGCNPPANTRFCPGSSVTREQMASFLARALRGPG